MIKTPATIQSSLMNQQRGIEVRQCGLRPIAETKELLTKISANGKYKAAISNRWESYLKRYDLPILVVWSVQKLNCSVGIAGCNMTEISNKLVDEEREEFVHTVSDALIKGRIPLVFLESLGYENIERKSKLKFETVTLSKDKIMKG